jgi:hypothetical protein
MMITNKSYLYNTYFSGGGGEVGEVGEVAQPPTRYYLQNFYIHMFVANMIDLNLHLCCKQKSYTIDLNPDVSCSFPYLLV